METYTIKNFAYICNDYDYILVIGPSGLTYNFLKRAVNEFYNSRCGNYADKIQVIKDARKKKYNYIIYIQDIPIMTTIGKQDIYGLYDKYCEKN